MKYSCIIILLFSCISNALSVEFYDSGVGDKSKTVLEINCNGVSHRLVLKKDEVNIREQDIIDWFDKIKIECDKKGEEK